MALKNSAPYVEEAIESVLGQSIGTEKIQLILVENGSEDDTFAICERYARRYPDNVLLIGKDGGGVSAARNVGVRFATGKYVNFMDSDDRFSENVCAAVAAFFERYEKETDVVTIRTELFGEKVGDTWFNRKFEKGTRLIDLWKEPQVYLNSTNNSFFHRRILNQLHFDESLSIAEDLKVVNLALMNKWRLGAVAECTYFYRIRPSADGSLAFGAKEKEEYYLPYLEKVFFELFDFAVKRCGSCPDYLQYTLLRDLWNRFDDNRECVYVLSSEDKLTSYKKALFRAVRAIDDRIYTHNSFLRSDEQLYFLSLKHGAPKMERDGKSLLFRWEGSKETVRKTLYACFERAEVRKGELRLEGYAVIGNLRLPFGDFKLRCRYGEEEVTVTEVQGTKGDKRAFADEVILHRRYFKLTLRGVSAAPAPVRLSIAYGGAEYPIGMIGFGKWFPLSDRTQGEYFCQDGVFLTLDSGDLIAHTGDDELEKACESKLRRALKRGDAAARKALRLRRLYFFLRRFSRRPLWILSDRKGAAGDNGQALYEYLRTQRKVRARFAIAKSSPDYRRLKKAGCRPLDLESKRYKIAFLLADVLLSSHFDGAELAPIAMEGIRDLIARKGFVFLQHGVTKDDVSDFYSRKKQNLDLFLTASPAERESILSNPDYFLGESEVKLTGFPRYDKLYHDEKRIVLVMPTWRRELRVGEGVRPDLFLKSEYYRFYHTLLTDPRLLKCALRTGYRFLYFSHFNLSGTDLYMADVPNLLIPSPEEKDYAKAFAVASLLVTDYSSTAFDFAYLRKPILYCQGDESAFYAHHTYARGYFDYERDGFGEVTRSVEEAVDRLVEMMEKGCPLSEKYRERIDAFFPYRDRENAERAYRAVLETCGGKR